MLLLPIGWIAARQLVGLLLLVVFEALGDASARPALLDFSDTTMPEAELYPQRTLGTKAQGCCLVDASFLLMPSPAATPSGPAATSQAAAGSASMANVMSHFCATSAGLLATCGKGKGCEHVQLQWDALNVLNVGIHKLPVDTVWQPAACCMPASLAAAGRATLVPCICRLACNCSNILPSQLRGQQHYRLNRCPMNVATAHNIGLGELPASL
jgi:hypothetical protein